MSSWLVQVTVVPLATVSVIGEKLKLSIVTAAGDAATAAVSAAAQKAAAVAPARARRSLGMGGFLSLGARQASVWSVMGRGWFTATKRTSRMPSMLPSLPGGAGIGPGDAP